MRIQPLLAQTDKDSANTKEVNYTTNLSTPFSIGPARTAFAYNQDEGIIFGLGLAISSGNPSHRSLTDAWGIHASSTGAWRFRVHNEFMSVLGHKNDMVTDLDIRIPNNISYFYGYGMSSIYDKSQGEGFRYYRARYDMADLFISLRHRVSSKLSLTAGVNYEYYEMDASNKFNARRFITQTGTGSGKNGLTAAGIFNLQKYLGYAISFHLDTRNDQLLPGRGVLWQSSVRHLYQLKSSRYDPTILNSDLSFYLPLWSRNLIFANRTGFGTTFGRFSFQHAQYLGNNDNLRGFRKDRWAGTTKWYNQADLRWRISNVQSHLLNGPFGMVFFTDVGRVWTPGEVNNHMAVGYGGGFWFLPVNKLLLTFNYALSKENRMPSITMEWRF